MPKPLQKSLQDYLSKIKKPPTPHIRFPSKTLSSSKGWILRGCKHPKTLSFSVNPKLNKEGRKDDNEAATLADIDRFLFDNFKSLYMKDDEDGDNIMKKGNELEESTEKTGRILLESSTFDDPPADPCGSHHRFFVGPRSSSSLVEEDARTSTTAMSEDAAGSSSSTTTTTTCNDSATGDGGGAKQLTGADNFIALFMYSPSPHDDFKHSMQEMIEARLHHYGKVDWEFMEEILFCYLDLNDKKSYKYILSAFVDLVVILRENSGKVTGRSQQLRSAGKRS